MSNKWFNALKDFFLGVGSSVGLLGIFALDFTASERRFMLMAALPMMFVGLLMVVIGKRKEAS